VNPTTDRLNALRTELEQRGVVDVKFYFERGSLTERPDEIPESAARLAQCFVDGNFREKSFGDIA